jgi:heme transport system permease protein
MQAARSGRNSIDTSRSPFVQADHTSENVTTRPARNRRVSAGTALGVLMVLLLATVVLACGVGAFPIAPATIARILLRGVGFASTDNIAPEQEAVLWSIRLPRVLLAVVVGGGLGAAGAAMQALFRNPLADPSLTGVSGGAALAATSVIVMGASLLPGLAHIVGVATLPLAAFGGGLVVSIFVYRLATRGGHTSIAALLLAGIALNALAEAGIGLFTFIASDEQLRNLTFWRLGSVAGATWSVIAFVAPAILLATCVLVGQARAYDALALGEAEARYLGVRVERIKSLTLVCCALAAGTAVAVSGMILFVGLVAPHLVRLACGPAHRVVLPGGMLVGAILVVGADAVARTIAAPAELPLGVFTALIGVPFFIALLMRQREAWNL